MAAAGFALGLWTVRAQLDRGHGTPLPVMPTRQLLTDGPYRHSRNPMTLGAIVAYLGVAVAARSPAGIGLVRCSSLGNAGAGPVDLTRRAPSVALQVRCPADREVDLHGSRRKRNWTHGIGASIVGGQRTVDSPSKRVERDP
jgi:hypothetical protein